MTKLEKLSIEHSYHCHLFNYSSSKHYHTWETMTDFLNAFEAADTEMNLVFRWDVRGVWDEENGEYKKEKCVEVCMIRQRKGVYDKHDIESIGEEEAKRFEKYLNKHWEVLREMWRPISPPNKTPWWRFWR